MKHELPLLVSDTQNDDKTKKKTPPKKPNPQKIHHVTVFPAKIHN